MSSDQTIVKVKGPQQLFSIRLPIELINIIFILAAETSRHACLNLCLVASWARQIALRRLFRTLLAGDHIFRAKFHKYLAQPPYIPFNSDINAAALVKNVYILPQMAINSLLVIFQNCHNITHLAVNIPCFYKLMYSTSPISITGEEPKISGLALDNKRDLHLTLLGTPSFTGDEIELFHSDASCRSPLYDQVTHVRIEINSAAVLYQISHFNRLSHISLPYTDQVAKVLDSLPQLEMFVVTVVQKPRQKARWKKLQDWIRSMRKNDKRVFFVEIPAMGIQTEWEEEMMGAESIWDRAFCFTIQWEAKDLETSSPEKMPRRSRRNATP